MSTDFERRDLMIKVKITYDKRNEAENTIKAINESLKIKRIKNFSADKRECIVIWGEPSNAPGGKQRGI